MKHYLYYFAFFTLFLSFLIKNFATQQSQTAWKIRDVKLPGVLHLEGQIQSLIKSSAKELGGFVSAFLTAHHSTIQSDLAALAQETSSRRSVLVHWEIAGIMVTHPTAHSTHHQGRDSILQVTVDPQIQLHCSNRGVGGFLIFFLASPSAGTGWSNPPGCLYHRTGCNTQSTWIPGNTAEHRGGLSSRETPDRSRCTTTIQAWE